MATACNTSPYGREKVNTIGPDCMDQHKSINDSSATSCNFDCSICLEESQDPVVTMCGHLFCWACLYQWISIHSVLEECPVCKSCVKDKIIPLYGRGKAGFAKPEFNKVHDVDQPRRPSGHSSLSTSPRAPGEAGFQYIGQQSHGFIAQENYGSRGAYPTSSVTSFGLFPALFGIHTVMSSDHNGGYPFGTPSNSMVFRLPPISGMSSQQRRLNAQREFVLYWFLILLAGFVLLCLLLF